MDTVAVPEIPLPACVWSQASSLVRADLREQALANAQREVFDVIVIGAGITGAGIAYEAARQGLKVCVVDANDFASGTSSRSSKLIHGGFRYLAKLEIGIVRKTARERAKIRHLAPHLTQPQWMVIPLASRSKHLGYQMAVRAYEAIGALPPGDRNQALRGADMTQLEPSLNRERFPYAIAFREYQTDDARLVLANLRAATRHGALAFNHLRVTGIGGKPSLRVVQTRCTTSGQPVELRGKVVVNAAGPWVEEVQRLVSPTARHNLHLSQGTHIALPWDRLPVRGGVVVRGPEGRYMVAMRRGSIVYVGPTDTSYGEQADWWPEIARSDIDYLLSAINRTFAVSPLTSNDILGAWTGLRPLVADPRKATPSDISRRDEVVVDATGMISIAGGKLTGYRDMARCVFRIISRQLAVTPASSAEDPLPGGEFTGEVHDLVDALRRLAPDLPDYLLTRLAGLYGAESRLIVEHEQTVPSGAWCGPFLLAEVDWAWSQEGVVSLEDLIYRRLRLPLYEPQAREQIPALAHRLALRCNWTHDETLRQIEQLERRMAQEMRF